MTCRQRPADETIAHRGRKFAIRYEPDSDHGAPWEEFSDSHGPVSDWTTRAKAPGERVLSADGRHKRFYDFAAAVKMARRDGWGVADGPRAGESARAYAVRAVEKDFLYLQSWCRDEWHYVGVVVTLIDAAGRETADTESVWGIEDNDLGYMRETAIELADQIMAIVEVENPIAVLSEN